MLNIVPSLLDTLLCCGTLGLYKSSFGGREDNSVPRSSISYSSFSLSDSCSCNFGRNWHDEDCDENPFRQNLHQRGAYLALFLHYYAHCLHRIF